MFKKLWKWVYEGNGIQHLVGAAAVLMLVWLVANGGWIVAAGLVVIYIFWDKVVDPQL